MVVVANIIFLDFRTPPPKSGLTTKYPKFLPRFSHVSCQTAYNNARPKSHCWKISLKRSHFCERSDQNFFIVVFVTEFWRF